MVTPGLMCAFWATVFSVTEASTGVLRCGFAREMYPLGVSYPL
jgi:hypothetical protein